MIKSPTAPVAPTTATLGNTLASRIQYFPPGRTPGFPPDSTNTGPAPLPRFPGRELPMRLGIRYRLLLPLLVLTAGVVGAGVWECGAVVRDAERRIAERVRSRDADVVRVRLPPDRAACWTR